MNRWELRRTLVVVLPTTAAVLVVAATVIAAFGDTRRADTPPARGDHWHATYSYIVCGQRQPNFPTWEAGVHTHADGIIHIHPFIEAEGGPGARLVKWFEYGGGLLTDEEVRAPGSRDTYRNGDLCPDGRPGEVQVFVNDEPVGDLERYIPQDGDVLRIIFGPLFVLPSDGAN